MPISFSKMHGLGNDFVVIDTLTQDFMPDASWIKAMSDRRLGIGFDQLLLLEPCKQTDIDFIFRIFNADGGEVEQCGNGARCIGLYIQQKQLSTKSCWLLKTLNRVIRLEACEDGEFLVEMGHPSFLPQDVPFITEEPGPWYTFNFDGQRVEFAVVSLGNPHAVVWVESFSDPLIHGVGQALQQFPCFPQGVNVNFARVVKRDLIELRVYERGVGLTQACGTGACASVAVGVINELLDTEVKVMQLGGALVVRWSQIEGLIYQKGPAIAAYQGVC